MAQKNIVQENKDTQKNRTKTAPENEEYTESNLKIIEDDDIPRIGVIKDAQKPCKCFDPQEQQPIEKVKYTIIVGSDEFVVGGWCDSIHEQKKMMDIIDDNSPTYTESLLAPYRDLLLVYGKKIANGYLKLLEYIIYNPNKLRDKCMIIDSNLFCQLNELDTFVIFPQELTELIGQYFTILRHLNIKTQNDSLSNFPNNSFYQIDSSHSRAKIIESYLINNIFPQLNSAINATYGLNNFFPSFHSLSKINSKALADIEKSTLTNKLFLV